MKPLLVVILHSGEQEHPLCLASLAQQSFREHERHEISGLASYEAHQALYRTIQESVADYHYFLKLDADMVFRTTDSLAGMLAEMRAGGDCDHATWQVLDFLSETRLEGIHMFSNRARWTEPLPRVFVDPVPVIPGRRLRFPPPHECPILHCPAPSRKQAFQYGLHRGTKCFTASGPETSWAMRHYQFRLISAVWHMFLRTHDAMRGMFMLGAEWARTRREPIPEYRLHAPSLARFEQIKDLDAPAMIELCQPYWQYARPFGQAWCRLRAAAAR